MIDTFTRWPVAVPIKDRSSTSVANAIYKYWICEKGVPLKIVSDQAREFISKGMKQLAAYMGTCLITTSGYNPTGNSSVERFHRYLNALLVYCL
jgi:transposase InsO family protein